jgi:hypothetical protein
MAIKLQAWNIGHERRQQRLTLNKRQGCGVAAIEMQVVESVKDKAHAPCTKARNPPQLVWLMFHMGEERSHHQWKSGLPYRAREISTCSVLREIQNERQGTRAQVQGKN